jgi:uncharacterized protein (DUF433 family)
MNFDRITIEPNKMGGVPCIRGLRIPIATIVGMVDEGISVQDIVADYPDIEAADIQQAVEYTAQAWPNPRPSRDGRVRTIMPTHLATCSHLAAYWLRGDPLGDLLGEAIDAGEALQGLWHPRRPPVYVRPDEVCRRSSALRSAWERTSIDDEWSTHEARVVSDVYSYACAHGEAIVSALEAPMDRERGDRVIMPNRDPVTS